MIVPLLIYSGFLRLPDELLRSLAIMNIAINLPPEKMAKAQTIFVMSMQRSCLEKCIVDYNSTTLSSGERICTDRCVQKYHTANDFLSKMYQSANAPSQ